MVTHQTRSAISKSVGSTEYEILDGHRRDLVSLLSQKKKQIFIIKTCYRQMQSAGSFLNVVSADEILKLLTDLNWSHLEWSNVEKIGSDIKFVTCCHKDDVLLSLQLHLSATFLSLLGIL